MYEAEKLIKDSMNEFRDAFLNSVDISLQELELDQDLIINNYDKFENSLSQFKPIIFSTMTKAAKRTEKPRKSIELNLDKEMTLNEANRLTGNLITNINSTQREVIRYIINDGIENNYSHKVISKKLRTKIGLNFEQIKILDSMEESLLKNGTKVSQIEKIINIKSKQMLKLRADTIALTESARAVSSGRYLIQQQMFDDGDIDEKSTQKWLTGSDERVCYVCGPMNNTSVGMKDFFISGTGQKIQYPPVHPRCGCIVIVDFK